MDVETKKELTDLTVKAAQELLQTLLDAKAFVIEQAPDIFRQIIAWQIGFTITMWCLALALVVLFTFVLRKAVKLLGDYEACRQNREVPFVVASVFIGIVMAIALLISVGETFTTVKAIVAPKLFLIDYVRGLLK